MLRCTVSPFLFTFYIMHLCFVHQCEAWSEGRRGQLDKDGDHPLSIEEMRHFSYLVCNFTARYFGVTMVSQANRSVVISPMAVLLSYIPYALFSDGKTHQELYDVFGLNQHLMDWVIPKVAILLNISGVETRRHDPPPPRRTEVLELISSIYVNRRYHVTERFNDTMLNFTGIRPKIIDFADPEKAEAIVNADIANRTHNLIKHLIRPDLFTEDASIISISSTYFRGDWLIPFSDHRTRQGVFYSSTGNTTVTYMVDYENENYEYLDSWDLDSQIIVKRYFTHDLYGCMFLLPNARDGIKTLIEDLSKENVLFDLLQRRLTASYVNVTMPRFALEATWNVTGILSKMGVKEMYSSHPNFHDVLQRSDGDMADEKVRFSASYQGVKFDINETGSDAAITMRHYLVTRRKLSEHHSFRADHSFAFVVFRRYLPLHIGVYEGDEPKPDISARSGE